jgi:hypothetical protein
MVDQLFRTEAVDAYTERWLGELYELPALPQLLLAALALLMLTALIIILVLGSYRRQTTVSGLISGAREEVVLINVSTAPLHVGEHLPLSVQAAHTAGEPSWARIVFVSTSSISSGSPYRVTLEIPAALRRQVGVRFLLHVPLQRRHVYQWMFPCLSN